MQVRAGMYANPTWKSSSPRPYTSIDLSCFTLSAKEGSNTYGGMDGVECVIHNLIVYAERVCVRTYLIEDALLVRIEVEVVGHLPGGDDLLCVSDAREAKG